MKVKELIEKLQKADADLEIFCAPVVFLPTSNLNVDVGTVTNERIERSLSPVDKFPIEMMRHVSSLEGEDAGTTYIVLGFDADETDESESGLIN